MQKIIWNQLIRFSDPILETAVTYQRRVWARDLHTSAVINLAMSSQTVSSLYSWLHRVAPAFPIKADKVHILTEPSDFYNTLLSKCASASKRIVFSSLYLGTGELERALVESVRQRIVDCEGQLKVRLLFDYCRGSRGTVNSKSMVMPLLKEQPDAVQVSLYHTVALRGLLRWILPERFNEIIGLQHMKLYIFDNTLIISGANLSHDYFTNRQDRYVMIEDSALADFYSTLISEVCKFSFQLLPNGSTALHSSWPNDCHPYKGDKEKFIMMAREQVWKVFSSPMKESPQVSQSGVDTWIFPLIQMGQLKITQDSEITLNLLGQSLLGAQIHLATGYFNLPTQYMDSILKKSQATFTVLTAHPTTNGFLNAKGIAGGIPALYTHLAKGFYFSSCKLGQQDRVQIKEYIRPGWTYHGKGLWLSLTGQRLPSLTFIGSPNFGSRSIERDLETQLAIVTSNPQLQQTLADERDHLYNSGQTVNKSTFSQRDRIVPIWVICISQLFRRLF